MSFIRPEVQQFAAKWAETAIYATATCVGAIWLWGAAADPYWRAGLILVVAVVGFALSRAAYLSARSSADSQGPGVVLIDERRITYLGPEMGGFASINALEAIEIWAPDPPYWEYETRWILRHQDADEGLAIPTTAEGASGLIDAFSALPGFEPQKAIGALRAPEGSVATIWRRTEPSGLAIAAGRT